MTRRLYWGDTHNHCGISYGYGSLENALAAARKHLDFCSMLRYARPMANTPGSHPFLLLPESWKTSVPPSLGDIDEEHTAVGMHSGPNVFSSVKFCSKAVTA